MCGAIPPLPYVFTAWCLIKHRGKFNFGLHLNNTVGTVSEKVVVFLALKA
jgi:hypothetical protein